MRINRRVKLGKRIAVRTIAVVGAIVTKGAAYLMRREIASESKKTLRTKIKLSMQVIGQLINLKHKIYHYFILMGQYALLMGRYVLLTS